MPFLRTETVNSIADYTALANGLVSPDCDLSATMKLSISAMRETLSKGIPVFILNPNLFVGVG